MTSNRSKRRAAKFVLGLWTVAGVLSIPSAAWASHQCAGIEISFFCPFDWSTGSVCIGDAFGEGHPCGSTTE